MEVQSFTIALMQAERSLITSITAAGSHQAFHQRLLVQLRSGDVITLDCRDMGELLWHVSAGETEFQIRLRRAFIRSLYTLLAAPSNRTDLLR